MTLLPPYGYAMSARDDAETVFQVLNAVIRYRMEDGQLELYHEAGFPILVFAADQTSAVPDDSG